MYFTVTKNADGQYRMMMKISNRNISFDLPEEVWPHAHVLEQVAQGYDQSELAEAERLLDSVMPTVMEYGTDEVLEKLADRFPEYDPDRTEAYTLPLIVQYGGVLWRLKKEHVPQENWRPGQEATLWERVNAPFETDEAIEIPDWEQGAWGFAALVRHNGRIWRNNLPEGTSNVWEPGHGGQPTWDDVTDEFPDAREGGI